MDELFSRDTTGGGKKVKEPIPHYASYTYNHPSYFVRYPHRKRNKLLTEEIIRVCPEFWLDYGAGDGALLGELKARDALLPPL